MWSHDSVRAKGHFDLHGVQITKIIPAKVMIINPHKCRVTSQFVINLHEYKIKVPKSSA